MLSAHHRAQVKPASRVLRRRRAPDDPHQSIIKRVVGLEGDVVWDEDAKQSTSIPQGRCWIEGDNTSKSGDSRSMYGPVSCSRQPSCFSLLPGELHHAGQTDGTCIRRCDAGALGIARRARRRHHLAALAYRSHSSTCTCGKTAANGGSRGVALTAFAHTSLLSKAGITQPAVRDAVVV